MKYRHKPAAEIEAILWTGLNIEEVAAFVRVNDPEGGEETPVQHSPSSHELLVTMPGYEVTVQSGEWLMRDPYIGLASVPADRFDATYEPVDQAEEHAGDRATPDEPPAQIPVAPEEAAPAGPPTCPHAWAAADNVSTITCTLEPGHEGAHVGPDGEAPPA